jgi:hypothetical protein
MCFYSTVTNFAQLNQQDICPVCNILSAQTFQPCYLSYSGSPQFQFFLKRVNFDSTSKHIFILSLHALLKSVEGLEMSGT